jgi:NAD(P)-dependent dehydrogenase (short-subunit alcohol dehydrogenase family)
MRTMQNNVCLLTGANSGIGRVTARTLAEQGATLIMICRNKQRGEQTLEEIRSRSKNNDLHLFIGDLSSQAEIRRLAMEIIPRFPRIDVLLNNAGGINSERTLTIDGLETTFAVNHLAYFLLTNLILPSLLKAPAPRIVNVSSQAHQIGRINFDDLGFEKSYNAMKAYAQSKLANVLFTYELARRLSSEKITVNTLHPGTVNTRFGKELQGIVGSFFRSFGFLMRSPEKGAETLIWLATDPELSGVSGKYYCDKKVIRSLKISHDGNIAKQLWDVSARLTGIVEGPKP